MIERKPNWYEPVPRIRRRLFRGWLSRHPEYYQWSAEFQHQVEIFVRQHGELYAQKIAGTTSGDPFIELTDREMADAKERYESQKHLRIKRQADIDGPPANLLHFLAQEPDPYARPITDPPTATEIARVDAIMAQWRGKREPEPNTIMGAG